MNKKQVLKQLQMLNKQLVLANNRMYKISQKLNIPENEDIKKIISEVEELIKLGEKE